MHKKSLAAVLLVLLAVGCAPQRAPVKPPAAVTGAPKKGPVLSRTEMRRRILAAHNAWRKRVKVPPLQWSEPLAKFAQLWAYTLQVQGCDPEHRSANKYGENIEWAGNYPLREQRGLGLQLRAAGQLGRKETVLKVEARLAAFISNDHSSFVPAARTIS
ncbi:MAG: CAP domain-containing protein [Deltaproteobacteria bacterium]